MVECSLNLLRVMSIGIAKHIGRSQSTSRVLVMMIVCGHCVAQVVCTSAPCRERTDRASRGRPKPRAPASPRPPGTACTPGTSALTVSTPAAGRQPVVVRVRVEIMGSPKCGIVGESQSVLNYDQSHYLHPHPYDPGRGRGRRHHLRRLHACMRPRRVRRGSREVVIPGAACGRDTGAAATHTRKPHTKQCTAGPRRWPTGRPHTGSSGIAQIRRCPSSSR
jgi:hypothetical protein